MLVLFCRDLSAYQKKIRKAKARRNIELTVRLLDHKPTYKLDHIVKER